MELLAKDVILQLLSELFKNEQLKITVQGALQDSATVAATTLIGGFTGGPGGAIAGSVVGTVILSASKALGYNDQYKPLPEVLNSLSKDEKDELCTRMRDSLVNTSLMSKYFLTGALQQMVKAVQQDPETYESIKNMLKEWFITKKQYSFK